MRKLASSERKDQDVHLLLETDEWKDWRKRFEKKDFSRSPSKKHSRSQCWAHRKGDCTTPSCSEFGKKCAVRHQQTEEHSSQKPKQKVTTLVWQSWIFITIGWNIPGLWAAEVFKESTEEHTSWDQLNVQRFTKATLSHSWKSIAGSWCGGHAPKFEDEWQKRCASREMTWVQSTRKLNENWDATSLVFLSAVLEADAWQIPEHNVHVKPKAPKNLQKPYNVTARVMCKIVYDEGLITWNSAKSTDEWNHRSVTRLIRHGKN